MLDAYNVFNYPENGNNKLKINLRKERERNKSILKEELLAAERNNRSLVEKNISRNELSPAYSRDNSVILPILSRRLKK